MTGPCVFERGIGGRCRRGVSDRTWGRGGYGDEGMDRKRCLGDIAASPPYRDLPRDPARDGQDRATGARFVADAESRRGTGLPRAAAERLLPVAIRPVMLLERITRSGSPRTWPVPTTVAAMRHF